MDRIVFMAASCTLIFAKRRSGFNMMGRKAVLLKNLSRRECHATVSCWRLSRQRSVRILGLRWHNLRPFLWPESFVYRVGVALSHQVIGSLIHCFIGSSGH